MHINRLINQQDYYYSATGMQRYTENLSMTNGIQAYTYSYSQLEQANYSYQTPIFRYGNKPEELADSSLNSQRSNLRRGVLCDPKEIGYYKSKDTVSISEKKNSFEIINERNKDITTSNSIKSKKKSRPILKLLLNTKTGMKELISAHEPPKLIVANINEIDPIADPDLETAIEYYVKKSIAKKLKYPWNYQLWQWRTP